jgi:hypothetical protein
MISGKITGRAERRSRLQTAPELEIRECAAAAPGAMDPPPPPGASPEQILRALEDQGASPGRLRACTPRPRSQPVATGPGRSQSVSAARRAVEERIAQIRAATYRAVADLRREIAHTFIVGQRVFVAGSHFADLLGDGSEVDRTHAARWGAVAWHEAVVTRAYPAGCNIPIPQRTIEIEYVERGSGRASLGVRYVDEIPATLLAQWRNSHRIAHGLAPFPIDAPR